jgi:hypothetical protein
MIVILKILNKTKIKINSLEKVLKILKKISHKNGLWGSLIIVNWLIIKTHDIPITVLLISVAK